MESLETGIKGVFMALLSSIFTCPAIPILPNKVLEYPINIKCPNPRLAKFIISQYGGPDGELAASLRYLSQRFGMPDQKSKAILNDIRN